MRSCPRTPRLRWKQAQHHACQHYHFPPIFQGLSPSVLLFCCFNLENPVIWIIHGSMFFFWHYTGCQLIYKIQSVYTIHTLHKISTHLSPQPSYPQPDSGVCVCARVPVALCAGRWLSWMRPNIAIVIISGQVCQVNDKWRVQFLFLLLKQAYLLYKRHALACLFSHAMTACLCPLMQNLQLRTWPRILFLNPTTQQSVNINNYQNMLAFIKNIYCIYNQI